MAQKPPQEQSHKKFAIVLTIVALVGGGLTWAVTLPKSDPVKDCGNRLVTAQSPEDC